MQTILQFVVAMDDGKPDEAIAIIKQGDCAIEIQIWIEVYDEDNPQHPPLAAGPTRCHRTGRRTAANPAHPALQADPPCLQGRFHPSCD